MRKSKTQQDYYDYGDEDEEVGFDSGGETGSGVRLSFQVGDPSNLVEVKRKKCKKKKKKKSPKRNNRGLTIHEARTLGLASHDANDLFVIEELAENE